MTEQFIKPVDEVKETWILWWELFNKLIAHTLAIALVVASIEGLDLFIRYTHHNSSIIFFENSPFAFPLTYLFNGADAAMIVLLSIISVIEIGRSVWRTWW
jgi:hypothetical protein